MSDGICLGRLVDDTKAFGLFGDGKHKFHLELRCTKPVLEGTKLCARCHGRPREVGKYHSALLHGIIGEPIPHWSHIFGGEWFRAKVTLYGNPEESEMAKGRKAHAEANKNIDSVVSEEICMPSAAAISLQAPVKPKRGKKISVSTTEIIDMTGDEPVIMKEPISAPIAEKPKRGRKKKECVGDPVEVFVSNLTQQAVPTQAVESIELPLEDKEIIKIVVKPFSHNGINYFLDAKKNKLYSVGKDKRPSKYHGRWNPYEKTIDTSFPDSDIEL